MFVVKRYDRKRVCFAHNVKEETHVKRTKTPKRFTLKSPEEVLKAVDATEQGLSSSEAEKRLAEFGHNELEEGEKRSILVKFYRAI